jgi:PHP family Zn ribbon phosphoesterase
MKTYRADLHIHTCLSPCAELEMSPRNVISAAKQHGLDIVGICDHNSCENVPGAKKSAAREGLHVIGGMEITSAEEVHLLALFDHDAALLAMQDIVYAHLPGLNDERRFGDQVVANEDDEVLGFNEKLLIGATELSLEEIVANIHALNGLAVAAHIDREGFGILGQLGFIPPGLPLDAVEVSRHGNITDYTALSFPIIRSSDAHQLDKIGMSVTQFLMKDVTLVELKKALTGKDGRHVIL